MSPSLPPEIIDLIVDHLRDEPIALKACCVISKSWIPWARIHLFASVEFHAQKSHIELWKKAFPDPSNSPAHHTRSLTIRGIPAATATDADDSGWIRAFHNLVHLHLEALGQGDRKASLVAFHGLSPTLRSLRLVSVSPEVLDLICSFPLLEDLALLPIGNGRATWSIPSTSPKLTGSLNLDAIEEARPAIRRLLDLPDGLHFTKITVASLDADAKLTTDLVSRCSDTLESLSIDDYFPFTMSREPPLDLSKATKLKDLSFRCEGPNTQRITMALQSVKSETLRQITIHPCGTFPNPIGPVERGQWQELDSLLVQFWTSHSIRPVIKYKPREGRRDLGRLAPSLLPELTGRGLVDLVTAAEG